VSGSTSGATTALELQRLFFLQIDLLGSTMGSRSELESLLRFLVTTGVRPTIDSSFPLTDAPEAFEKLASGDVFGKIVLFNEG
jgi:D-arabinose 1-dehydrogenase-like Zn-dependent alcohol dehydrogenase